jgi:hypothetical protein
MILFDFFIKYDKEVIAFLTFLVGFGISRFTMSKNERKQYGLKIYEQGKTLMENQNLRFQEFTAVLQKYVNKEVPTFDDFVEISTVGEKYFYQLKISSEAVLSGNVSSEIRDNEIVPAISEAIRKSLPAFYTVLQSIAKKRGLPYRGELKRENYESIYTVFEKYSEKSI